MSSKKFYVYACKVDGVVRYIGMGSGTRYKHCLSGTSSCAELNRDFFEGRTLEVEKVKKGLTKQEAEELEESMISDQFEALYNKVVRSYRRGKTANVLKRTRVKVVADSFIDHDKRQDFLDLMDIDERAFEDITETLISYEKQLYIVQDGNTRSVVIDDINFKGFRKTPEAHTCCPTFPFCTPENCEVFWEY